MPASFTGHFCQIVNIAKSKVNPVYIFRGLSPRRRVLNVNTLVYDMAVSYTSAQCSALTGSASDAMVFWAFPQLRLRSLARSFLHCPVLSNIYCISSLPHRVLPAIYSAAQPPRHLICIQQIRHLLYIPAIPCIYCIRLIFRHSLFRYCAVKYEESVKPCWSGQNSRACSA